MSSYMAGPLSDKPDSTTPYTKVAKACLPAGERPNKTTIFILGVRDTRGFLSLLRASCPDNQNKERDSGRLIKS